MALVRKSTGKMGFATAGRAGEDDAARREKAGERSVGGKGSAQHGRTNGLSQVRDGGRQASDGVEPLACCCCCGCGSGVGGKKK